MADPKSDNQDARTVYGDIIDLPHHTSATRPKMSLYDRAAQFSPFAALTGYDEMIGDLVRQSEEPDSHDFSQ